MTNVEFNVLPLTQAKGRRKGKVRRSRALPLYLAAASLGLLGLVAAHADVPLNLVDLKGHVVYLDFWASWCAPCRQSFPWMQQMQDSYGAQGLEVVAVDVDRNRPAADRFLDAFHPTFEVRFDPKGDLAERFKVQGMPTGLLIDRQGVVRFVHIGFLPVDRVTYENELRQLLSEQ